MSKPERRACTPPEVAYLRTQGCTCDAPEVERTPIEPDPDLDFPTTIFSVVPGLGIVQHPVRFDVEFVHANGCPVVQREAWPWN